MVIYIVTCEWNNDGVIEWENMLVTTDKQKALDKLAEERKERIADYESSYGDDFEVIVDNENHFEVQYNDYDYFEICKIETHNV